MKYPLGIQTFAKLREDDYVYVDKTTLIYELITTGSTYFFSRPRRFGKSLLVSTLESLFRGERDLFKGLAIADTDYDFAEYPIVLFEFTNVVTEQAADVKRYIINTTNMIAEQYSIELTFDSFEERVSELIRKLYNKTGKPVVLLVDEYDKPILDSLFQKHSKEVRKVLAGFYAVIKQADKFLKFVFITGVSKFAKISVFSGMNSLTDISMNLRYATICGVTEQELSNQFNDPICQLAAMEQLERQQLMEKLKHWYNGYYFHQDALGVYNPYSLLSLFYTQEFDNYWFNTATPTFLLDLLQNRQYSLKDLTKLEVVKKAFNACEPENMDVQSIFLQTGYLTIKEYNAPLYKLDFPNYEVKMSFYDSVATRYSKLSDGQGLSFSVKLIQYLQAQAFEDFFETLSVFFANIPNNITLDNEKYYQSLLFAIFKLIGLSVDVEVNTNLGRIDCVVKTDDMICIMEFKLNGTKEDAMQQIIDRKYAEKYQQDGKELVLIGVEFDKDERNIGGFLVGDIG